MNYKTPKPIGRGALFAVVVSAMLGVYQIGSAAGIDPTDKWAWSTNAGWINFNPTGGGDVAVYGDHLEGYIWAENVGWIRLGTHTGGSPHTYANTDAANYGVNRNATGHLSGYAWSTNVGWINFSPTGGGVTIAPRPELLPVTPGVRTWAGSASRGAAGPRPTGWSPIFAKSICLWS